MNIMRVFPAPTDEGVAQFFVIVVRVVQFVKNVEGVAPIVVVKWSSLLRILRVYFLQ